MNSNDSAHNDDGWPRGVGAASHLLPRADSRTRAGGSQAGRAGRVRVRVLTAALPPCCHPALTDRAIAACRRGLSNGKPSLAEVTVATCAKLPAGKWEHACGLTHDGEVSRNRRVPEVGWTHSGPHRVRGWDQNRGPPSLPPALGLGSGRPWASVRWGSGTAHDHPGLCHYPPSPRKVCPWAFMTSVLLDGGGRSLSMLPGDTRPSPLPAGRTAGVLSSQGCKARRHLASSAFGQC